MHLNIFASQSCFLHCKGCYSYSREEKKGKQVPTDKLVEFLDFAYNEGTRKVTLNATDSLCNITKIKVAKKSEISGFDDFKTKGEEISFIHGKTVNITYTAPEDDTYVFFIEDESGYQKRV